MARERTLHRAIGSATGGIAVALALGWAKMSVARPMPTTWITLTQAGCQFLEPGKGLTPGFEPGSAEDCNRINADTGDQRLANAEVLELSPGTCTFRVTNPDVPYETGLLAARGRLSAGQPAAQAEQGERFRRRTRSGADQRLHGRARARRVPAFLPAQSDPELPAGRQGLIGLGPAGHWILHDGAAVEIS